jgi:hypothetical protein
MVILLIEFNLATLYPLNALYIIHLGRKMTIL